MNSKGMTMAEVTISFSVLAIAVLGVGSTTARLARVALESEAMALGVQVAEERLFVIETHPVYTELDSLFSEDAAEVPGLPGFFRTTVVLRIQREDKVPGGEVDLTKITVWVRVPGLGDGVSRTTVVGAP
jgi:hypothetical protein